MTDDPATGATSLYERYKDALRRGHVAALRGRLDAAIEAYSEAAAIAPDRALPYASVGGILVRMGRIDEALASYEKALGLAPRDEAALRGLADVLAGVGRRAEAADALDRLVAGLEEASRLPDATDAARRALELAESKPRREQMEELAGRLRASDSDEATQRALDQALRYLEPASEAEVPTTDVAPGSGAPATEPSAEPATELEAAPEPALELEPASEPPAVAEPELAPEPAPDGVAIGRAAEDALNAGDVDAARSGLLAAAAAHRAAGRPVAALDACYLALAVAPADADLHLMLAELYLERGWRSQAADKLLLLARLAELGSDQATRDRLCALAAERLPDEPRLAELCA